MSGWRRCDRCRRVLAGEEFDGDATTCRACLATPVGGAPKPAKAGPVTRTRKAVAPRPAAAPVEAGPRQPLLGVAGSGDLEVRERRARRAALDELAEAHAEEFAQLLASARQVEGLRSST
ncbi:MAG: hypothetical protein JWO60_2265 [Frankiales bacterium]|nr:hypothetical protein [Frankiales bacterium]